MGRDKSVGIATRYGLDVSGIESQWGGSFSASIQTGSGAHPTSCKKRTGSLSYGLIQTGLPHLVPMLKK